MGRTPSALLVSLPWTVQTEPNLGLGLLKAVLEREGVPARVMHLNLRMLRILHSRSYDAIARVYSLNDFLFAHVLEPEVTSLQLRWLRAKIRDFIVQPQADREMFRSSEEVYEKFLRLRRELIPPLLAEWADEIAASDATVVGFSCMFDQTIASVALAKLVRERAPDKLLALGGYAVRSPAAGMLLRAFPWLDAVCDGEGEPSIGPLARASAGLLPLAEVPGLVFRGADGEAVSTPAAPRTDLNENPVPDFSDWFRDVAELSEREKVDVHANALPLENSRGCWWGQKNHCVFCGIRAEDMAYRARAAERVVANVEELWRRHAVKGMRFADYILPRDYFSTLLPALARREHPWKLFGEVKANMGTAEFELLAEAGFSEVQPGIESFSTPVLKRMKKGVTGLRNVFTLLNGRAAGMRIFYNLIHSFPGDDEADYAPMLEAMPRLLHLEPPETFTHVLITRDAPLHTQRERFGLPPAAVEGSYELLFSQDFLARTGFRLEDFAYYFERDFENPPRLTAVIERLRYWVLLWKDQTPEGMHWLDGAPEGRGLRIRDSRAEDGEEVSYRLDPGLADLLLRCTQPAPLHRLGTGAKSASWAEGALDELDRLGLILRDGKEVLSLVLPVPRPPHLVEAREARRAEGARDAAERQARARAEAEAFAAK